MEKEENQNSTLEEQNQDTVKETEKPEENKQETNQETKEEIKELTPEEKIKDLEDKEGDISIKAKTVAIVLGDKKTKIISIILSLFVAAIILACQYFQYQGGADQFSIIYTGILQTTILLFLIKLYKAKNNWHMMTL